ncbi:lysozyme [Amycolatopsis sp. H20-H5]|uniref:lysozyme n=1 Tax=Amycolatopsis sp. H20-H5 TaxID=3046309 RepID=UPI002DB89102|nr:lysozyme [Amycolatopsis sp. H20-H5]MEC3975877.1 lysozyme [Amycolatopsis sp. H20-H5]
MVGTTATSSAANPPHPELDYAGSTIAAHEGNGQSPFGAYAAPGGLPGVDISNHQGGINWAAVAGGNRFVYMKATEGTGYRDPTFSSNYTGSYNAGMIRGAYHFALPDNSSGAVQARYFVSNGGGWSADGKTLPPMLDIEYNPYGATCYGLNQGQMSGWIADFSNEVHRLTSRYPTIYTTRDWWSTCTGNNGGFGAANPLFIACYCGTAGTLPNGWGFYTFWQYSSTGRTAGINGNVDQDVFNGPADRLRALALG